MSTSYSLEIEDSLNPDKLLLDIMDHNEGFNKVNDNSIGHIHSELVIDAYVYDIDEDPDYDERIKDNFGFKPRTTVSFWISKSHWENSEYEMGAIISFILTKITGNLFLDLDTYGPILYKKKGRFFISKEWKDCISREALNLILANDSNDSIDYIDMPRL